MSRAHPPLRTRLRLAPTALGLVALASLAACGGSSAAGDPAPTTVVTTPASTTSTTSPATTTTTSTSTTTTTTTTVAPELPVPMAPPDPRAPEPRIEIGRVQIPEIGVDEVLLQGISLTVLDQGPGHWPGTARPGGYGNAVITGHRTTHGAPFLDLDQLEPGDEIRFETAEGVHVYEVTGSEIVTPDAMWIVEQKPGHTATLFACHPKGSTSHRIVVFAELVT